MIRTALINLKNKQDMKKIKFIYGALLLSSAALFQWGCAYDPYENDISRIDDSLKTTVSASADAIALDGDHPKDVIVTFNWTKAREMSDEYIVSYTTKLDVVGNNFGSSTAIVTSEEDGIFSHSFTSEQLNNWANEKWKLPVNKKFTLEFRVIVEWAGGPTFEIPDVSTVEVEVTPIKVEVFDADKMSLAGSAMDEETEISKTVENVNRYAWLGNLTRGELQIPVQLDGLTYYITPADGDGTLKDGQAVSVKMQETPVAWEIKEPGQYRVVIDMKEKQATIYSPATDMKSLFVTFRPNGAESNPETTMEVTELWAYGGGTGWGAKKLGCTQSLADPQILVYNGAAIAGDMKFCIAQSFTVGDVSYNQNNVYCFTCPLTPEGKRQNLSLELNKEGKLYGASDGETRNSYYKIPSGTNQIIFDLRNLTIKALKIEK